MPAIQGMQTGKQHHRGVSHAIPASELCRSSRQNRRAAAGRCSAAAGFRAVMVAAKVTYSDTLEDQVARFETDGFAIIQRSSNASIECLSRLETDILEDFEDGRSSALYRVWRQFNRVATAENRHSVALKLSPNLADALQECIGNVRPFLDTKMSPASVLVELSSIISFPGAEDQEIHSDTPWVEDNDLIISGFLALSPMTIKRGPTCLFPGTHTRDFHSSISSTTSRASYYAADGSLETDVAMISAQPTESSRESSQIDAFFGDSEDAVLDAGDLLLFDTRVFHYGSANISQGPRPLVCFSFQSPRHGTSIRAIDGFTYHCHRSVRGKSQLRDFGGRAAESSSTGFVSGGGIVSHTHPIKVSNNTLASARTSKDW